MKLVACRCPQCSQPLHPQDEHVIVSCEQCYAPAQLGDDGSSLASLQYAAPQTDQVDEWLPVWVFEGTVHVLRRDTQGGRSNERDSQQFWEQPRRLYTPAWNLNLRQAQEIGSALIQHQPSYQATPSPQPAPLKPAVLTAADARKMLEFIVLAIEARREDWLKNFEFRLEVGEPELWALPSFEGKIVALDQTQ